ncbi:unnamed protein product [Urochloa humidicola]
MFAARLPGLGRSGLLGGNPLLRRGGLLSEHAEDDDEDSDEEFDMLMEWFMEDTTSEIMYGMYNCGLHASKYLSRSAYREVGEGLSGLDWVRRRLRKPKACYNMFRMGPDLFCHLHDMLVQKYGLRGSSKSTSIEALALFLWIVGAPQGVRQAEDRFERSLATVHNLFYKVLDSLINMSNDIINPKDRSFSRVHDRLRQRRFTPLFNGCIGAIDGSHVPVLVPSDNFVKHICRKGTTTQNVMAVCDFDMIFTFVLAGYPGSAHDMTIFQCALDEYGYRFPHPPAGKYYLVDSGYPNRTGYLSPYKGTKYHIQEYQNANEPRGKKELFNYAHSSLRNVIERSFGVLKMKWRILRGIPCYPPDTQSKIVLACCALHNFIRLSGYSDRHFDYLDRDVNFVPPQAAADQPPHVPATSRERSTEMNAIRETIALGLATRAGCA